MDIVLNLSPQQLRRLNTLWLCLLTGKTLGLPLVTRYLSSRAVQELLSPHVLLVFWSDVPSSSYFLAKILP